MASLTDEQLVEYLSLVTCQTYGIPDMRDDIQRNKLGAVKFLLQSQMVVIPYSSFNCRRGARGQSSLTLEAVFEKLVRKRLTGSRIELNILFAAALKALDVPCVIVKAWFCLSSANVEHKRGEVSSAR